MAAPNLKGRLHYTGVYQKPQAAFRYDLTGSKTHNTVPVKQTNKQTNHFEKLCKKYIDIKYASKTVKELQPLSSSRCFA